MSCYVEYDRIQHGRQSIGLCGDWVDAVDIANEPTCLECQRRLAQTAAAVFGPEPPPRADVVGGGEAGGDSRCRSGDETEGRRVNAMEAAG